MHWLYSSKIHFDQFLFFLVWQRVGKRYKRKKKDGKIQVQARLTRINKRTTIDKRQETQKTLGQNELIQAKLLFETQKENSTDKLVANA